MGYTHYWRQQKPYDDGAWLDFAYDAKVILTACADEVDVEDGWSEMVTRDSVVFNGVGEEGHETFLFNRAGEDFAFCKTAGKPYDVAVTACLIRAKVRFGEEIKINSDGDWCDWIDGRRLVRDLFGSCPSESILTRDSDA